MMVLAGCAQGPYKLSIDRSITAVGQDSRVEFLVLHYTAMGNDASLRTLSRRNVSSHYLISDEPQPRVYQLVDESRRAWHAGLSEWYGRTYLNNASIGIEIVNDGPRGTGWAPYRPQQIVVLAALLRDILTRHAIKPQNIVGHADVAPQRKIDPGPLFPWKQLAAQGLGRWYDEQRAAKYRFEFARDGMPDVAWAQHALRRVGYALPVTGELDEQTRKVIAAFQMHYRPALYDGNLDVETAAILKALP